MFHHFWNDHHPHGQGAMSAEELDLLIGFIGRDRLLPAHEWHERTRGDRMEGWEACLTFDDGLRCQVDVALPVLEAHGLTAFWFVHTAPLVGEPDKLETYRYYRTTFFDDVLSFYEAFEFAAHGMGHGERLEQARAGFDPNRYLEEFPFYTAQDRWFRFVRDEVLGPDFYQAVMDSMLIDAGLTDASLIPHLWMNESDLRSLDENGHVIGLHSHSHPTRLDRLTSPDQANEYQQNLAVLSGLLGRAPTAMSHPCNAYTSDTLAILERLGVDLGFRSNMAPVTTRSRWEMPREDHANLLAVMHS